jgi:pyrroline-5-carboxylate reductase
MLIITLRLFWEGVKIMDYRRSIAFIGGGNMAEAIAAGIVRAGVVPAEAIFVSDPDPERCEHLRDDHGFNITYENPSAVSEGGTLFLTVKPQVLSGVLEEISGLVMPEQLVISIAAGVTLKSLETLLPGIPVIRSMPNTPSLLGAGATAITTGSAVETDMTHWAVELFHAVGTCHVFPEDLMDAVTGLSGSGPAYIFRMAEALTEAGKQVGIPEDKAADLVRQTILGAARMMCETDNTPTHLREMVTSPGGTTQAGLKSLDEGGFEKVVMEAVRAATKRAKELGKG